MGIGGILSVFKKITVEENLILKEITTPEAVPGYAKIYPKDDNVLYFQDGAGEEHTLATISDSAYGEAYIYNNSNATIIETANTPIALRQIAGGLTDNFTFHAGSNGAITAFADYSGTVAGTVLITSGTHGLSTGKIITIRGTTNYNGIFAVTVVSVDTFYITTTWVSNDGTSDWDQGASLACSMTGVYVCYWRMNTGPEAACVLTWTININTSPQSKSIAEKKMAVNDYDSCSSSCLLSINTGDVVWLSVQSNVSSDITNKYGEFNIHRIRKG